ncbi:hypothetical protein EON79_12955 [bacterium]|nr:MAG: hypothetical protein EON79_12955 [bacterium]
MKVIGRWKGRLSGMIFSKDGKYLYAIVEPGQNSGKMEIVSISMETFSIKKIADLSFDKEPTTEPVSH